MNSVFIRHNQMVRDLIKPSSDIMQDMSDQKCALIHSCLGIAGEVMELRLAKDDLNVLEECGDIAFYFVDITNILNLDISEIKDDEITKHENGLDYLIFGTNGIVDIIKKHVIYNQDLNLRRLEKSLAAVMLGLCMIATEMESTIEEILEGNINKLTGPRGRYPSGKYSDHDAAARADKAGEE